MGQYSSYYLYQKYEKRGSQDWIPCIPNTFSVSGDSQIPMPFVMKTECDTNCGCSNAQYRWINLDPTVDWVCDGTTKYYKQQRQVSYDNGETWTNLEEYQKGAPYEYNSDDCSHSSQYLTFVATEDGTFQFTNDVMYSLDNGRTWETLLANTDSPIVSAGSKIMWKGELTPVSLTGIGNFSSTNTFTIQGNAMSLLYGDDFADKTNLASKSYAFMRLFMGCTGATSAAYLILPATTLSFECYNGMFIDCTSLLTAPELPATTLAYCCYYRMFENCTSLTVAPELPATTLASTCYDAMFKGCTSLTVAPELLATTLTRSCYVYMFQGCTSLTEAPELPATTLTVNCYRGMFWSCTSLTVAPELPATTLEAYCYDYMFSGCTSLSTAPELPATTLAEGCYSKMFEDCTSLTTVPSDLLPATTLANKCYNRMFLGCTSLTTAPDLPATTLAEECYSLMFYNCTNLNYIKCLATDISATDCTLAWVQGILVTGTFTKAASMNSWTIGTSGIPSGWIIQNA